MAIFNSYVNLPEGTKIDQTIDPIPTGLQLVPSTAGKIRKNFAAGAGCRSSEANGLGRESGRPDEGLDSQ